MSRKREQRKRRTKMLIKRKKKELSDRTINIWNQYDFAMSGLGEKSRLAGRIKHFIRCLKWSKQRIVRGYADTDVWDIGVYLQRLMPDMLKHLKDHRMGSPGFLGENYTNEEGFVVNDTCHAEWNKILDKMIFLWRETDETTCSKQNPYEEEYMKAFSEFQEKYGLLGEKLRTRKEREENKKHGVHTIHFMDELPEYKEIHDKHREEDRKLEQYRSDCKDEALDMLKEYFYSLWD